MTQFIQTLMDGIAVGSLYALIALGYTLVYGILQFINFAHSDVFALGAWASFVVATLLGLSAASDVVPPWDLGVAVLLGSMLVCGIVGFTIERLAYRPLRNAPRLNVLITAIGVSLLLENVGQLEIKANGNPVLLHGKPLLFPFGPYPQSMPSLLPDKVLATFAGVQFRLVDAVVLGTAAPLLMIGIQWLIFRTKLGPRDARRIQCSHGGT